MKQIDVNHHLTIQGGLMPIGPAMAPVVRVGAAGAVGIGTFNAMATTIEVTVNHIQALNKIGASMGEAAFNATHPDPLGQMVYEK